ncbi:hypothetical protein [Rubellimicrobium roseum]|uniref:Uncharacterized protein n=1 Tax=Rubellimicrobium roseum TaxID=687525 RepID=A0A5C4N6Z8_9RHOB|nr:hypothetical protein [Rubellimicrobium roseum]TNC61416.1 hypothetical protein FHG71_21200 [Rubellimicrobium roseum]
MTDTPGDGAMSPEAKAALLVMADELELWSSDLLGWLPQSPEPLEAFQRRRAWGEGALVKRLRELPGCHVTVKEDGALVELILGGIRVRSADRLKGACEAWIAEARRRAGAAASSSQSAGVRPVDL